MLYNEPQIWFVMVRQCVILILRKHYQIVRTNCKKKENPFQTFLKFSMMIKYLLSLKNFLSGLLPTMFPFTNHIFMKLSKMLTLKRTAFFSITIQSGGNVLKPLVLCI